MHGAARCAASSSSCRPNRPEPEPAMSQIPGLRMLVKLKERRLVQLDEATKLHQQRLGEQIGALNAVLEEERGCRGQEAAQRERLHALSTGTQGFRASDVVTLHGL